MNSQDIFKDLLAINKKYLFFKEMEDLLIGRISEVLEKLPQIIEQRKIYISIDLEVHNNLKNLFLKHVIIKWHVDEEDAPYFIFTSSDGRELGRIKLGDKESYNRQIWGDEFTNNILLPSISILIKNFFYLVNLDKELSSHKG